MTLELLSIRTSFSCGYYIFVVLESFKERTFLSRQRCSLSGLELDHILYFHVYYKSFHTHTHIYFIE